MIHRILPSAVASFETISDLLDDVLFPVEEAALGNAVEKRRREFISGRACARRALGELGLAPTAIPVGPHREPQWPPRIVGSITHCRGYRACVVGWDSEFAAIGIDAEPNVDLSTSILHDVACDDEIAQLRELSTASPFVCWDRLLFCAKEAVYKVWFPLERRSLRFEDAIVSIDPEQETFTAQLSCSKSWLRTLSGRWSLDRDVLLTAIVLPSRDPLAMGR